MYIVFNTGDIPRSVIPFERPTVPLVEAASKSAQHLKKKFWQLEQLTTKLFEPETVYKFAIGIRVLLLLPSP